MKLQKLRAGVYESSDEELYKALVTDFVAILNKVIASRDWAIEINEHANTITIRHGELDWD